MKRKAYAYGFGSLFAFALLAVALTGQAVVKVQETCIDGLNNDGDVIPGGPGFPDSEVIDVGESSCLWMPFSFGPGEAFPDTATGDSQYQAELGNYLVTWDQNYADDENKFTHFDAVSKVTSYVEDQDNYLCGQDVEDSFVYWRSQGVSSEQSGILEHQAYCGTTY